MSGQCQPFPHGIAPPFPSPKDSAVLSRRSLLLSAAPAVAVGAALITPSAALAAPAIRSVSVSVASSRSAIRALQLLLTASGAKATADGKLGPATNRAIRTFQSAHRLAATGSASSATMASLMGGAAARVTGRASNASAARAAQTLLGTVTVDGKFGPASTAAVRTFQRAHSLPSTGIVDHLTWSHLFAPGAATPAAPTAPAGSAGWSSAFLTAREDRSNFSVSKMTATQEANARFIIAVGKGEGIPEFGIRIALATAIVESWMYNLYRLNDRDSGGLFQQRPGTDWGTYSQVRNKHLATKAFFGVASHTRNPGLTDVRGWQSMSLGKAAQKVQRSAYPSRYQKQAAATETIYRRFAGSVSPFRG